MNKPCDHEWTAEEYESISSRYCYKCQDYEVLVELNQLKHKLDETLSALVLEQRNHELEKRAHERTWLHKSRLIDELQELKLRTLKNNSHDGSEPAPTNDFTELEERQARVRADMENARLRGILAKSTLPCIYCGLTDMALCKSGFPGCGRMDDLVNATVDALISRTENGDVKA
jgi:hypothetical protein